ncbi:MAG: iron chelate uptake ABC transporter family permease subunit, partial [Prevotella nigrescens]|nr:iron chelate uptake ABC transporter family permease subunit [Prevotella nigrescens]
MKKNTWAFVLLPLGIVILFLLNLYIGSVRIPFNDIVDIFLGRFEGKGSWRFIVLENRLPQAITAMFCGGALAVSGLMLQTAFRNPLAGPDVFGINAGAGLGVALVMLLLGGNVSTVLFSVSGFMAVLVAAFAGAMAVTALIFFFSLIIRNSVLLLIIGIMVGYMS